MMTMLKTRVQRKVKLKVGVEKRRKVKVHLAQLHVSFVYVFSVVCFA